MSARTRLAMRNRRRLSVGDDITAPELERISEAIRQFGQTMDEWCRNLEQNWPQIQEALIRAGVLILPEYVGIDHTHGMTIDELVDGIDQTLDEWKGER